MKRKSGSDWNTMGVAGRRASPSPTHMSFKHPRYEDRRSSTPIGGSSGGSRGSGTDAQGGSSNDLVLLQQRRNLPMAAARSRFLEEVAKHETVILIGETGCGKTTQIPQYIHEARLEAPRAIAITQPRRMAAISIAKRVAQEMRVSIGSLVGYKVRFEDCTDTVSRLIYLTDGMLLREAMLDPLLSRYSWIVLDEAHERTISTDILFGVVKAAQRERRVTTTNLCPLKIIVMSATLDAEKFSNYFHKAPILYVSGRQFPVDVRHVREPQDDWQSATLSTLFQIHQEAPERHDMLVFLTGQEEIETMMRQIRLIAKDIPGPKMTLLCLFAAQQTAIQQKVFFPTKPGCRKIVLATNIAETSLTIPGIRYVIDSCRVKAKVHQPSTGLDMLKVVRISQAQAWQRTGRAGRDAEGQCYRMVSKAEFDRLPKDSTPEILRCNLSNVILQILSIGVKDIVKFDFMQRPPSDAIEGALRQLKLLGAVDDQNQLTPEGKKMAAFPIDPKLTKMILRAKDLGVTEEIVTIVALMSGESILVTPSAKKEEAFNARRKFVSSEGDLITCLKIFRAFKSSHNKDEWCQQHFVHQRNMNFALEIRKQLMDLCHKLNIPIQSNVGQTDLIRRAIAEGMFVNVAKLTREGHYVTLDSRQQARIHPSSVMFQTKPELVVFTELISTQKNYIRDLTLVDANWLLEAQPEYYRQHRIVTSD